MRSTESPLCWIEAHSGNPDGKCNTVREILESECAKAKPIIDAALGNNWPFCELLNEYFKLLPMEIHECSYGDNPGHPLKPKKIVKASKRVDPLRTPEGRHFREEAAKLDRWIFQHRLNDYFKEKPSNPGNPCPLGNPYNPRAITQFQGRGSTLPGRQMWLLRMMCLNAGIDTMHIDSSISYWANKAHIEELTEKKLRLGVGKSAAESEEARYVAQMLSDQIREDAEALADYARSMGKNN